MQSLEEISAQSLPYDIAPLPVASIPILFLILTVIIIVFIGLIIYWLYKKKKSPARSIQNLLINQFLYNPKEDFYNKSNLALLLKCLQLNRLEHLEVYKNSQLLLYKPLDPKNHNDFTLLKDAIDNLVTQLK